STLYIRFWRKGTGGGGTFSICAVTTGAAGPPANDNPCGATVLPPNTSCTNTASTNVNACPSTSVADPSCGSYLGSDIWFSVTTTSFGTLTLNTVAGSMTDAAMALYSATACNGSFTQIDCDDDDGPGRMPTITAACLPAATYSVRDWGFDGVTGTFDLCAVFTSITPPTNDTPCTAAALTVNASCSLTAGTNVCATNGSPPGDPGCGNFNGSSLDVWYSFTAPSNGIAILETTAGTLTNASMALYSGSCGALTLVECDADHGPGNMPSLYRNDLTGGATYFVRIWGSGGSSGTFNLCVTSPTTPTGFSCTWLFELFDTSGDGWGASQISVSINGGAATTYTVTQGFNAVLIGLNVGQSVSVSYSNAGPNQDENSYRIRLNASTFPYFNSGTPPGSGVAFTQTVNCLPPGQTQEDCLGAKTLCGSQDENANPNNTGNVADLFPANYGCLASAERQGLWYIYRMTSGGRVGMTLDPDGNDDYDWAIWGPYPSTTTTSSVCAPAGPPSRCSYASGPNTVGSTGSYNTGMGNATYSGVPQFDDPSPSYSEGSSGNGWVPGMNTITGEVYLLYISNFSQSGLAFLLTWQLTNGASLDCTVLPVEFMGLSASDEGDRVRLDWSTLSEHNSDYFVVERSSDGEQFSPLGAVEAAGESQQRIEYAYVDPFPMPGANYYRLKQVDLDGAYEHTPRVVVLFGRTDAPPTVFPNPAQDLLNVAFSMPVDGTAYVQVIDASGRVVRDRDVDLERGAQTVSIRTQDLPAGAYEMRLFTTTDQAPHNVRFIKE
ncbi:MAG: T9SS type A sorting domain-containing protein, partial [Flavobacteriales bacterium]|nr:T9SS type A sorting domain-containing protein [Flavobacteriales bacterium]